MDETKYIPLNATQFAMYKWAAFTPPSVFNLCVRIDFLEDLDESVFAEAARLTVERLPYCRYRIHKMPDGSFCQYETKMDVQNTCEFYDRPDFSEKKLSKLLTKWAGEPFPDLGLDTQLYRFRLIRLENNKHCFFLCGHHIIMDIYAVVFVASYLAKVYDALIHNTDLPPVGADPEPVTRKLLAFASSEKLKQQEQWYLEQNSTEPQFTSLNGVGHKEFVKGKRYGRDRDITQMRAKEVEHRIPKQLLDNISKMASKKNISPYVFYVAALRTYLSKVNETDDVLFTSLIANRGTLAEKSSGLLRVTSVAFRSILSDGISFDECLSKLDTMHRDYLRRLGPEDPAPCDLIDRRYGVPQGMRYYSILLSYAPFIDYSKIPLKIKATKIDAGVSITSLYILLMHTDCSGDMSVFYQYAVGYIKPENIDKFHAFMLKFLEAGIADPNKTIAQLTEECM